VDLQAKMKVLIEKTENDDKLIKMLKEEIKRLEQSKGVKSQLTGKAEQPVPEIAKLKNENVKLKNDVSCLEVRLEKKEAQIKQLMTNCVGAPDENLEEKELRIAELEDKVESLEKQLFTVK